MKTTISRTEVIPFLDKDGIIMQMRNFEIGVTVEGDSAEEAQAELDRLFQSERDKVSAIVPLLKTKNKTISFLIDHLRQLASTELFKMIIEEAKKLQK